MSTIEESHVSNNEPTGPERRTWGTYGVFVAFGLSAIAYIGLYLFVPADTDALVPA